MEILTGVIDFGPYSGAGPIAGLRIYTFPRQVRQASVILTGFTAEFDHADHEVGALWVELNYFFIGRHGVDMYVWAELGLRDWSGEWDDTYSGQVRYCVVVELEPIRPIPTMSIG